MKKLLPLLALALLLATPIFSQIQRNQMITVPVRDMAGAIEPLSAEQTFSLSIPDTLNFYQRRFLATGTRQPGGTFNSLCTSPIRMNARLDRQNPGDYQFTIVASGLENLSMPNIVRVTTMTSNVEFTYNFSASLEVRNSDGELIRTFILFTEAQEHRVTIGPNFLEDVPAGGHRPAATTFNPGHGSIAAWIDRQEERIMERIEWDRLREVSRLACEVITATFGVPRIASRPVIYGLHRRDAADFSALNAAVEAFQSQIEQVFNSEPLTQELIDQLIQSGEFFAAQYTSESSREMIQIGAVNAGIAFLLAGNTERAMPYLRDATRALPAMRVAQVTAIFRQIAFMNQFRNSDSVIEVFPPTDFDYGFRGW